MRASARLGLYGTVLVAVFATAFAVAGAVVPEETVQAWAAETDDHTGEHAAGQDVNADQYAAGEETSATGLALEADGYRLTGVSAPAETYSPGELALTVQGPDGQPVTDLEWSHEKELHLIVVRTDGSGFGHVHPERDTDGQWTIPWEWEQAGSYRVYAEFVPAATGEDVTLSTVVQVAGDFNAEAPAEPVTTQESYLGAYGHLVALRDGDLAYLHVHPHGAEFVLDTDTAGSGSSTPGNTNSDQHQTDGDQTEHEEAGGHGHGE